MRKIDSAFGKEEKLKFIFLLEKKYLLYGKN